jgi:ankyrin repeat protein
MWFQWSDIFKWRSDMEARQYICTPGSVCISRVDLHGWTALLYFGTIGRLSMIQWLLLTRDVVVGAVDRNGRDVFLLSVYFGHISTTKWLWRTGLFRVGAREVGGSGYTALLLAASAGHGDMVRWLLTDGGATVQDRDHSGNYTSLLLAARGGYLHIVQWLLLHGGACVSDCTRYGDTAFLLAVDHGHVSVARWLLFEGGSSMSERNHLGETAWLVGVRSGHREMLHWMCLLVPARRGDRTHTGESDLLLAAHSGNEEVVRWLLCSPDVSAATHRNNTGETALLIAARMGHEGVVRCLSQWDHRLLLDCTSGGDSVLVHAARFGRLGVLRWFIQVHSHGLSRSEAARAVCVALATGHLSVVAVLLRGGFTSADSLVGVWSAFETYMTEIHDLSLDVGGVGLVDLYCLLRLYSPSPPWWTLSTLHRVCVEPVMVRPDSSSTCVSMIWRWVRK